MQGKVEERTRRGGLGGGFEGVGEDVAVDVLEHAGHLETVHGFPVRDMFFDIGRIGQRGNMKRHVGGDHKPVGGQVMIARPENRVQHGFVEKTVAHPLGDNNINFGDWEGHFFNFSLQTSEIG